MIGLPNIPPFWALGWQAASDAYKTEVDWLNVVDSYNKSDMPLDVLWLGKSILAKDDFTYNEMAIQDMPFFLQKMKKA